MSEAGDPDDVAVNGAYLVVLRDLRDGDDQHDRVVDPAVAQRVHPEGQKLFDVEVPPSSGLSHMDFTVEKNFATFSFIYLSL